MEHRFIWNRGSFPSLDATSGYELLHQAMGGLVAVLDEGDRASIFCTSGDDLRKQTVCEGYVFEDFFDELGRRNEVDLQAFLAEVEDKSPAYEHLEDEDLLDVADAAFFFPALPYEGSVDEIALAWKLDALLLSIETADVWRTPEVDVAIFRDGEPVQPLPLPNVATVAHGSYWRQRLSGFEAAPTLPESFTECSFTSTFLEWFGALSKENASRVVAKLTLAQGRAFNGGEPLFKSLNDAEGLREIRLSAYPGGAIRLLFGRIPGNRQAMLVGFVKKSNNDGYGEAIPTAIKLWKALGHV